jgi:transcriptional regulator with XRE-family HTH domain
MRTPVTYDVDKLLRDMAARGWIARDLARAAGVSDMAVSRFLNGEIRTPRMAKKFADALGYSVRRYLAHTTEAA